MARKHSNCNARLKNAISEPAKSSVIAESEWRIRKKSNEKDKKVN